MLNDAVKILEEEIAKAEHDHATWLNKAREALKALRGLGNGHPTPASLSNVNLTQLTTIPQHGSDLPVQVIPGEYTGMQVWVALKNYLTKRNATPANEGIGAAIPELVTAMQVGGPKMRGGRYKQAVLNATQNREDVFKIENGLVSLRQPKEKQKTA